MPTKLPFSAPWHSALRHQGNDSLCIEGWGFAEGAHTAHAAPGMNGKECRHNKSSQSGPLEGLGTEPCTSHLATCQESPRHTAPEGHSWLPSMALVGHIVSFEDLLAVNL